MTATQKAAKAKSTAAAERARAAEQAASNAAKQAAAPAKGVPRPGNTAPPGPTTTTTTVTPPRVDPFFTPDDINAMGEWMRTVGDNRATAESSFTTAKSDTAFQLGQLQTQAGQAKSGATDDMIARGLFQSSVKDAALFDIEAQRATQQGYLNDRLATATTDHDTWVTKYGGVLSDGTKVEKGTEVAKFEQNWAGKSQANAQAVNDAAVPYEQTVTTPAPAPIGPGKLTTSIKPPATAGAPNNHPSNTASGSGTTAPGASGTATPGAGQPAQHAAFQSVPGVDSQGNAGTWHVYSDGRPAVFVKSSTGVRTP